MAKVPGTFDGQRYEDVRVLIPAPIKEYYEKRGEWDSIVRYRSYVNSESITVRIRNGTRRDEWMQHEWRHAKQARWYIADDSFDYDPIKK
jgi:hypothetical protein